GFGNAGSVVARLLRQEYGCRVVALSDSHDGVYNPRGIDVVSAERYKQETGVLSGLPNTEPLTNAELLTVDCDILVPAAVEGQITAHNADRVRARLVAEAANGPTTPDADQIMYGNGRMVIPDILANAGGVTVSYFEWVQDKQAFFWTEAEINEKLRRVMTSSFHEVLTTAEREQVDLRTAAYLLAVDRVASATSVRGLYP
ncbi:MAG: glutamate dehydrogenase, partial [Chloroflexota bacterium]|nr:glutamate dehydrogenase [Chloroflexota bacterium]